jgi:hypothetical protein
MSFADLIKKGSLRQFATATVATVRPETPSSVATVNVATAQKQAANDLVSAEPHGLENLTKPDIPPAANDPAQGAGLIVNPVLAMPVSSKAAALPIGIYSDAWRVLRDAYYNHHAKCPICQAAGRSSSGYYGPRCGTGAALWIPYDKASERTA